MTDPDRLKLLHGPYRAPSLRRGDRTFCLLRDCEVVITGISNARIPWPRCRAREGTHGGGSGLWLGGDLARAVETESAAAVRFWWRLSTTSVYHMRRTLGVTRTSNEGTRRLIHAATERGAAAVKEKEWTDADDEARSARAKSLNLIRFARAARFHRDRAWKVRELRLLGKIADAEVAGRTGRSANAVRLKRARLGIANPEAPAWTAAERALLGTAPDAEVAATIGRTEPAVRQKRRALGIPGYTGERKRD